ncbi:hypothetical protein E0J20_09125 [Rhizobium leguminosarum bv. viciae]|nr:hypothetical protein E0J20_09125 [Rhizobium leguminosarum bv. viciae]
MAKKLTHLLNMPVLIGLIFVCAVLIRFDHAGIASGFFWAYFAVVLLLILRHYRWKFLTATEFYAMGLGLICCFVAVKVVELASSDYLRQRRADNPTVAQMAAADDVCPDYLKLSKRDRWEAEKWLGWGYCDNYRVQSMREKWRAEGREYLEQSRLKAAQAAKIDPKATASTTETSSGLWK